jgi:hypothetical protein
VPPLPKWFKPVAIIALIWNLMGCAAYLMDVTISPEALAQMTPEQQALYASRPTWAVAMTAIAVWGGALGCVGLLMRKKWATGALLASLLGVIGQDVGLFGLSGVPVGADVYVMQGLVAVVAVLLVLFARTAAARQWIG